MIKSRHATPESYVTVICLSVFRCMKPRAFIVCSLESIQLSITERLQKRRKHPNHENAPGPRYTGQGNIFVRNKPMFQTYLALQLIQ